MATFKAVVFQTGRHIKLDGTSNIKIRIYHNRESQYISTAYYIRPENMDESGRILSGVTNGEMIEYEINAYIQKIRREYLKLGQDRTQFMSCMDLKEEIEKSLAPDAEFIDFVEFAQNIVIQTKKKKTAEWYSSSIDTLCWYTKRKKIDIKLITSFLLNKMIKDLYQSGPAGIPLEPGTISHYLRGLRALYNKAKLYYNNEDFDIIRIPGDPFKKAEIPEYRRKRGLQNQRRLTPRSLSTVLNDFSDAVAMLVGVLQLSAPIGVGIGRYALRLATEYLWVIAEAAFHYAAIGELEETQQQRIPAIHEWHELIVVYLHHVVAAQLR